MSDDSKTHQFSLAEWSDETFQAAKDKLSTFGDKVSDVAGDAKEKVLSVKSSVANSDIVEKLKETGHNWLPKSGEDKS